MAAKPWGWWGRTMAGEAFHFVRELGQGFTLSLCGRQVRSKTCDRVPRGRKCRLCVEHHDRLVMSAPRCRNGHRRHPGNTYTRPDGTKQCRECANAARRAVYHAGRA